MTRINNYEELIAERRRLEAELRSQKAFLKTEMNTLKAKVEPLGHLLSFLGIFKKNTVASSPLLKAGVSMGIDLLVRDNLLAKTNWAARILFPAALKFISNHLMRKKTASSSPVSTE